MQSSDRCLPSGPTRTGQGDRRANGSSSICRAAVPSLTGDLVKATQRREQPKTLSLEGRPGDSSVAKGAALGRAQGSGVLGRAG